MTQLSRRKENMGTQKFWFVQYYDVKYPTSSKFQIAGPKQIPWCMVYFGFASKSRLMLQWADLSTLSDRCPRVFSVRFAAVLYCVLLVFQDPWYIVIAHNYDRLDANVSPMRVNWYPVIDKCEFSSVPSYFLTKSNFGLKLEHWSIWCRLLAVRKVLIHDFVLTK